MGIDPGTANLGFGVIRVEGSQMSPLDGGVIETDSSGSLEKRLKKIHDSLTELIEWHRPAGIAIEAVYFGRNVDSAMKVGQASGVAMLAGAQSGIECFTYTPQAIKMAVCGSGDAGKKQVQKMVGVLLGLKETPRPDHAADALAVAICHGGSDGLRSAARTVGRDPVDGSLRVAS
jgi:crossover junction endodeoxyribonuclease RuvC